MPAFQVNDMTCGHCVRAITQAIQAVDPAAAVSVDLAQHRVTVVSAQADAGQLSAAIAQAGYTPEPAGASS